MGRGQWGGVSKNHTGPDPCELMYRARGNVVGERMSFQIAFIIENPLSQGGEHAKCMKQTGVF